MDRNRYLSVPLVVTTLILAMGHLPSTSVSAQPYAYVASHLSDRVAVIDTDTQAVVASVPVGLSPVATAVTFDGSSVYVANRDDNTVSVVSTATHSVIATVPVGDEPIALATLPFPELSDVYVANAGDGTVSVIDVVSNTVLTTIEVGEQPMFVKVMPTGRAIFVANFGDATLSIIEPFVNTVLMTVDVGPGPTAVEVLTQGRPDVFVASQQDNSVWRLNGWDYTLEAVIPVGFQPTALALSPDDAELYVANKGDGTVSVIDTATSSVVRQPFIGGHPAGIAVHPASQKVYVSQLLEDQVVLMVRPAGDAVHSAIDAGSRPRLSGSSLSRQWFPAPSGSIDGMDVARIVCRNVTTGQRIQVDTHEAAWNCESLGLAFSPGDLVRMIVVGDSTKDGPEYQLQGFEGSRVRCQNLDTTGETVCKSSDRCLAPSTLACADLAGEPYAEASLYSSFAGERVRVLMEGVIN